MKALRRSWAGGVAGSLFIAACIGCGGGGSGGRSGPMMALGVIGGSSGQLPGSRTNPDGSTGGSGGSGSSPGRLPGGGGSAPGGSGSGVVTFQLPSTEALDFVRVYVGTGTRDYNVTFDLFEVQTMDDVARAMEPRLGQVLLEPGVYFVALTVVDTAGRESDFSNELRVDTRGGTARADGSRELALLSRQHMRVWARVGEDERAGDRA
jgi:hypothetical protein